MQLPLSEKFGLAYTCGKCDTRNVISVSRIAWRSGVVVATCQGCKARHLLADNTGLLDLSNDTGFTNIVQLIEAKGDSVMRVDPSDRKTMADLKLGVGPDGRLQLLEAMEKNETSVEVDEHRNAVAVGSDQDVGSFGTKTTPMLLSSANIGSPSQGLTDTLSDEGSDEVDMENDEEVEQEPIVVNVPDGVTEGDVLILDLDFGRMHVLVPRGALPGHKLQVEGMVEVGLPQAFEPGEVAVVNLPDGTSAQVPMPEGATVGSTLLVGYPVTVQMR